MDPIYHQVALWGDAVQKFFAFDTALLSEPTMVGAICLQILLFLLSAFFSGSETALFSLSRLDLQKLRRDRHPRSETLHELLDQPRSLIISILCGNELFHVAATVNLVGILVVLYGEERAGWINVLVMLPLVLLIGEVTPKTIAVSNPVGISAGLVARPMSLWVRFITPLRRIVRVASDAITTAIVGKELARENILQVDEFRSLLADVTDEGVLDATERVLIDNLLEAGETEIVEIMTPRTRINFLKDDMGIEEVFETFKKFKHPRVPVCHEHHDVLVGFVHAEDILRLSLDKADLTQLKLKDIMHAPIVVPPTKYVDEMFDFFQANNARAAVVLNEFGGVEGMITMRDIISFIFGEIAYDVAGQELYRERDQNNYDVPGDMKLTSFNDLTNFGIEDPRMTTIGGVVFRYLDRLPAVGDKVTMDGFVAKVLEMDGHRLAKVRIKKLALDKADSPSGSGDPQSEAAEAGGGDDDTKPADSDPATKKHAAKGQKPPSLTPRGDSVPFGDSEKVVALNVGHKGDSDSNRKQPKAAKDGRGPGR